ncbi:hypothetical protein [Sporosarcina sp. PTS2304]|uniref:hypothetical protein n=1 Tax=Sporosarcina sp. PTS2304 TaxID=2283194 RepID=UPI0013B382F7|nr:hypothetical protein [Sporosarcina sp. PTS2304]
MITIVLSFCLIVVAVLLFWGLDNCEQGVKVTFIGTIEEIYSSGTAYVSEIKANDTNLSGSVVIDLPENREETFQVGDKVRVGHDGTTMEIAPVRIHTLTIEKIK